MKTLLLSLLTATFTQAATLVSNFSQYITSTVEYFDDGGFYQYSYRLQPRDIITGNLQFLEIYFVDEVDIGTIWSTIRYQGVEVSNLGVRWDTTRPASNPFTFRFETTAKPIEGDARFQIGDTTFADRVYVPSAPAIPEPSNVILGVMAMMVLFLNRKR